MDKLALEPFRPTLADLLREALADILDDYEHELRVLDSPLMKDEGSRSQCLAHARLIIEDTAEEIRNSMPVSGHHGLARDIGATRAASGVHPSESLRGSAILFASTMRRLVSQLHGEHAAEQVTLTAITLNSVIIRALRAAADSYAGMLLNRVHQAHVEERRRLSRELHDRIGHGISVAARSLELHDIYRHTDPDRANARMRSAQQMLGETIDVVRQAISDLRLVEPVESLEKAIKLFLERATGPNLISHVEVNGDEVWAAPEVIEEVFLIIREALRNVVAHAHAERVLVRVDVAPDDLRASVVDDGRGFQPGEAAHGGTGVLSMRERAAMLGGVLTISSHQGQGTRLDLVVPLTGGARS